MSSSVKLVIRSAARSKLLVPSRTSSSQAIGHLRHSRLVIHPSQQIASFTSSQINLKKKAEAKEKTKEKTAPPSKSNTSAAENDDPYDFTSLNEKIEKSHEKLKDDLAKLRTGGRFNPEALENVRVSLSKDSKESIKLGDLAQVIPKGRSVQVLVGEKDHVKAIVSAIQGAKDLNLQPVPDAHNPSQLNISIPPPTKESRDAALGAANKAGEQANLAVKGARGATQKKLRGIEVAKKARPDDIKKAHKEMEKIVEKATGEVKKTVDAARKTMEQS